jgi:hypothetical protein
MEMKLVAGCAATAPATNDLFWQLPHSWKIILLNGTATNVVSAGFISISNN